ncbi:MAG: CooT family nickel-binding protein [Oscillospiraceae bacterium]|jgi:predicted RNA-binding protein|nr:CooT family nickel-binding protein [Oscillospiraceae bacterium]
MCLSTAYKNTKAPEHIMARNVTQLTLEGGCVVLLDLMENEIRVPGSLKLVDLVGGIVIIESDSES